MRVNHERRLLQKAADAVDRQVSVRQRPDSSWPGDHSRLVALESRGDVRLVGQQTDRNAGEIFAVWQITERGLTALAHLSARGA
ncbi:hypothetical protein [Methylobacterium sp. A54F]